MKQTDTPPNNEINLPEWALLLLTLILSLALILGSGLLTQAI